MVSAVSVLLISDLLKRFYNLKRYGVNLCCVDVPFHLITGQSKRACGVGNNDGVQVSRTFSKAREYIKYCVAVRIAVNIGEILIEPCCRYCEGSTDLQVVSGLENAGYALILAACYQRGSRLTPAGHKRRSVCSAAWRLSCGITKQESACHSSEG